MLGSPWNPSQSALSASGFALISYTDEEVDALKERCEATQEQNVALAKENKRLRLKLGELLSLSPPVSKDFFFVLSHSRAVI